MKDIINLFGVKWKKTESDIGNLVSRLSQFKNEIVGSIVLNDYADLSLYLDRYNENDYYKILALLHEKYIFGKPFIIDSADNITFLKKELPREIIEKNTLCIYDELLNDFPSGIIDI